MRRSTWITVVRVAAMVGLVVIVRSLQPRRRDVPVSPATAAPVHLAAPGAEPESAASAARRILAAYAGYPALSVEDTERSVRALASEAAADRLLADVRTDKDRLAAGYPGGSTRVWHGALAMHEDVLSPTRRREDVWLVRVVAPPGRDVYAEWVLAGLGLVWERDGWRLDRFDESPGPRPATLPGPSDPPAEILTRLTGFEEGHR